MSSAQKVIKYIAITFGIMLALGIVTAIIEVIFAVSGGFADFDDKTVDKSQKYDYAIVENIKMDVRTGNILVETGDTDEIEVRYNKNSIRVELKNDTLRIESKSFFSIGGSRAKVKIIIPRDMELTKLDIELGVGEVSVDGVSCSTGRIDLGVGEITVKNSVMQDANLDLGIGDMEYAGDMINGRLDTGIGEVKIELAGNGQDYYIKADAGLGDEKINGKKFDEDDWKNLGASKKVTADCGIGDVRVTVNE